MTPERRPSVLILGGTTEGYALAQALVDRGGLQVLTSLAGRTPNPRRPAGALRIGGFGGSDGLAAYLAAARVAAVIDATHPFAATMGGHAATACAGLGVPLLRLERPPWQAQAGDRWEPVADWPGAVAALRRLGARRVLLAVGRQALAHFGPLDDAWFLVRCVSLPDPPPAHARIELLLDRGPFTLAGERALLARHRIDCIVCKNSGGEASAAKLQAARERGIPVIMHQRPPRPALPSAPGVAAALHWLDETLGVAAAKRGVP
jgi:precorrin-6A/cobalt-precorrin-6A reductase